MGSQNGAKGKRYKPRLYHIVFPDDSPWADAEAKIKGCSVDAWLDLLANSSKAQDVADGLVTVTAAERSATEKIIELFAPLIVWWNVDDDEGEPVAPDEAGVRSQDFGLIMALFRAWQERAIAVAPPLPKGSPAGPDPELASIPTETLPESPGS